MFLISIFCFFRSFPQFSRLFLPILTYTILTYPNLSYTNLGFHTGNHLATIGLPPVAGADTFIINPKMAPPCPLRRGRSVYTINISR